MTRRAGHVHMRVPAKASLSPTDSRRCPLAGRPASLQPHHGGLRRALWARVRPQACSLVGVRWRLPRLGPGASAQESRAGDGATCMLTFAFTRPGFPVGAGKGRPDNSSHRSWPPGPARLAPNARTSAGQAAAAPSVPPASVGDDRCGGQRGDARGSAVGGGAAGGGAWACAHRSPGEGQEGSQELQGPRSDAGVTIGCCFRDCELRDFRAVLDPASLQSPENLHGGCPHF